jgi:hypothetical protein
LAIEPIEPPLDAAGSTACERVELVPDLSSLIKEAQAFS